MLSAWYWPRPDIGLALTERWPDIGPEFGRVLGPFVAQAWANTQCSIFWVRQDGGLCRRLEPTWWLRKLCALPPVGPILEPRAPWPTLGPKSWPHVGPDLAYQAAKGGRTSGPKLGPKVASLAATMASHHVHIGIVVDSGTLLDRVGDLGGLLANLVAELGVLTAFWPGMSCRGSPMQPRPQLFMRLKRGARERIFKSAGGAARLGSSSSSLAEKVTYASSVELAGM